MNFVTSIETCFRKYADFTGRATRPELWWWVLFVILLTTAGQLIGPLVGGLVSLGTLLPSLAVTARRLHDTGRSGWWQLVGIVPLIGWLIVVYWCVQPSAGRNAYDGSGAGATSV